MKAPAAAWAVLLIAFPLAAQTYTPESLDAELARIDQEIQASVTPQLPDDWKVRAGSRDYTIPTAPLRSYFRGANGSSPDEARTWIANMRRDLDSFTASRPAATSARSELNAILVRKEFQPPPPPGALQQFWDRLRNYVGSWILSLLQAAAQHPTEARILFWALIAAVVSALIWWLTGFLRKPDEDLRLPKTSQEVMLTSWQEWIEAARAAAARGECREAIHHAYWAGIARLQLERTIHINLADTPRERLRSVTANSRRYQPMPAPELASLTAVTNSFERVWYADLPASPEDVDRAFTHLETLGCKVG